MLPEQAFRRFSDDPGGVRGPDVAFVAAGRVPVPRPAGPVPVQPDLAVEVVSPTDQVDELELTLADHRSAGIPLVWVVVPAVRRVRAFRLGDTPRGEPVLPGFAVAVLFPPPVTPQL